MDAGAGGCMPHALKAAKNTFGPTCHGASSSSSNLFNPRPGAWKRRLSVVGQEERSMVAFLLDGESSDDEEMDIAPSRVAPSVLHKRNSETRAGTANLLDVPPEIMGRILSFCPLQTILRYKVTSQDGRRISRLDSVWRKAYINQWPRLYRRDKIMVPAVSWQQAFKDRYLFTGGKPEDNQAEDWADFAIVSGSGTWSSGRGSDSPGSAAFMTDALTEEALRQEALQEFNRDLAPRLCECSLVGDLTLACILFQIREHLYVCRRSGLSHFCSLAAGTGPCNLSVENFHGCFTCRVTGISGTTAVEAEVIPRDDEYEEAQQDEMEIKEILEQQYLQGYYMTAREAATTFGFCGQIRDQETILDNPNLPNRKRRKLDVDAFDL